MLNSFEENKQNLIAEGNNAWVYKVPLGEGYAMRVGGESEVQFEIAEALLGLEETYGIDMNDHHLMQISGIIPGVERRYDKLIYPLMERDLSDFASIDNPGIGLLSIEDTIQAIEDTAEGLATLEMLGYAHSDIYDRNIYIRKGRYYLGDFGLAIQSDPKTKAYDLKQFANLIKFMLVGPESLRVLRKKHLDLGLGVQSSDYLLNEFKTTHALDPIFGNPTLEALEANYPKGLVKLLTIDEYKVPDISIAELSAQVTDYLRSL